LARCCTALQADLLFAAAARCYDRVTALDGAWRWRYARALIDVELGGADGLADRVRGIRGGCARFRARLAAARRRRVQARAGTRRPPTRGVARRRCRRRRRLAAGDGPPHVAEVPLAAYASLGLARVGARHQRSRQRARDPGARRDGITRVRAGVSSPR
jgi:hypothetical protein